MGSQSCGMLREQAVYQAKPFSKEEEALFAGTLKTAAEADARKEEEQRKIPKREPKEGQPQISERGAEEEQREIPKKGLEEKPLKIPESVPEEEPPQILEREPEHPKIFKNLPEVQEPLPEPQQLELFQEKLLAPKSRSRHKLIGQLFDTYWLVEFENKFLYYRPACSP